eukprot:GHVU01079075.1.p1 GENE.GHVU01079075.1~~GHVU01079075.1.p1  ORF type:complete len:312 (+),score=67.53 GHVU01079075.1:24-938(+)
MASYIPSNLAARLAGHLLERYLGAYLEVADPAQLSLALREGKVSLRNVKVKEAVADMLDIPLAVLSGEVRSVVATIPFWNIYKSKSDPVQLKLEGVELVLGGAYLSSLDPHEIGVRKELGRCKTIDAAVLRFVASLGEEGASRVGGPAAPSPSGGSGGSGSSILRRLLPKVLTDISVEISDIHIRLEALSLGQGSAPFALGLSCCNILISSSSTAAAAALDCPAAATTKAPTREAGTAAGAGEPPGAASSATTAAAAASGALREKASSEAAGGAGSTRRCTTAAPQPPAASGRYWPRAECGGSK